MYKIPQMLEYYFQVRDEYRTDYDEGRGGYGKIIATKITQSRDPMWPPDSMLSRRPVDWIGYVFSSELSFGLKEISDCGWKFKGQLKDSDIRCWIF